MKKFLDILAWIILIGLGFAGTIWIIMNTEGIILFLLLISSILVWAIKRCLRL